MLISLMGINALFIITNYKFCRCVLGKNHEMNNKFLHIMYNDDNKLYIRLYI